MKRLEDLIKKLQEAKEDLHKNMNCGYGSTPNMDKAVKPANIARPDAGFGAIIAKDDELMMGEGCTMKDMKMAKNGQWSLDKGAFKELESKLEHEGKSKESAGAIAYSVGKKKYGKEGMEHKAEAARKSDEAKSPEQEEKEISNIMMHKVESPSKREGDHNADQNHEEPDMKEPEVGEEKKSQPKIKETEKLERSEYFSLFKNGQWNLEDK
jgi:hypothetical protein